MRILTADGRGVSVRERSWPLAGMTPVPAQQAQGDRVLRMVGTLNGGVHTQRYIEVYKSNPWVWSAVQAIARGVARLTLEQYEEQSDGELKLVNSTATGKKSGARASQDLDRLLKKPNPTMSMRRLTKTTVVDELIFGNGLWIKVRNDAGKPIELWRAPWKDVRVIEGNNDPIAFFEVRNNTFGSDVKRFVPEDVIHFSTSDDPESPIGQSPMSTLRYTIALYEAIARHNVAFFDNAARPSGNIKLDKGTNKDMIELIRSQIRELYTSPENAGKVLVTTGEWQSMGTPNDNSSLIELVKMSREEIATVFRVPPPVLGMLERAIMANVRELREQYLRDVIGPWANDFEDDVTNQLVVPEPWWPNLITSFDFDAMLKPDLEARAKAYKELESTYTPNERRQAEGLPKLDDPAADTVWMPPGATALGLEPEVVVPTPVPVDVQGDTLPDDPASGPGTQPGLEPAGGHK